MRCANISYGSDPDQFVRIHYPLDSSSGLALPVVVIIHGGFWKQCYNLDNSCIGTLAPFFVQSGFVVCVIEYRRGCESDGGKGGFPLTNKDIISALQTIYDTSKSDKIMNMDKVTILGHSAGGTLALWTCCSNSSTPNDSMENDFQISFNLAFRPFLCVAIAPVGDLQEGHIQRLSDEGNAIELHLGLNKASAVNSEQFTNAIFRNASPKERLPIQTPSLIVIGTEDDCVPYWLVKKFYNEALLAAQEDACNPIPKLLSFEGANHFDVVNASSIVWTSIFKEILSFYTKN